MFATVAVAAIVATFACRHGKGRLRALALFLIGGAVVAVIAQSSSDARIQTQLTQLFPSATACFAQGGPTAALQRVSDRFALPAADAGGCRLLDDRSDPQIFRLNWNSPRLLVSSLAARDNLP
jgi:hypothetical protein